MLTRDQIDAFFTAFISKDLDVVLGHFADGAVMIDPHYPQSVMHGRAEIERGLTWSFMNLEKPSFVIRQLWIEGDSASIEVATHHEFKGGLVLHFDQVFVVETRDGKITRLQTYAPYAPHGITGFFTRMTRFVWRLQGRL
ncbi:MAG: nuclear transport factor 2 family protein [Sideroxydans sp.]